LLHNKKRAVHNIAVYCEERYAEKISKEKSCCTDFLGNGFQNLSSRRPNPLLTKGFGFCFAKQGGLK